MVEKGSRHLDEGDFISARMIRLGDNTKSPHGLKGQSTFGFGTIEESRPLSIHPIYRNSNASTNMLAYNSMSERQFDNQRRQSSVSSTTSNFARRLSSALSLGSNANSTKRGNLTDKLCDSAAQGDVDFIGRILGAGGQLNKKNKDGFTPLHVAAINGQPDSVRCLVRFGADIAAKDSDGYTPLHRAVLNQQVHLIAQLVNLGANVNEKTADGRASTSLHLAAMVADEVVRRRSSIASVESTSSNPPNNLRFSYAFRASPDISPLASSSNLGQASSYHTANTSPQLSTSTRSRSNSRPPLTLATSLNEPNDSYENCTILEALVRAGANLELPDKRGDTPLHAAARSGRTKSIETLLALGASMNTRNAENKTALAILASSEDLNTVASRILLERGAVASPGIGLDCGTQERKRFTWGRQRSVL
jgi:ankyrin repeat protein